MSEAIKKIRVLKVVFETEIKSYEIPAIRGAIIEKVGVENLLFHNHLNGDAFQYRYPLIQYKMIGNHPAIFCIDYGVDEIYKFFEKKTWDLQIRDRLIEMKIKDLSLNTFELKPTNTKWNYSMINWIALSQQNYTRYHETESLSDKFRLLESILTGNILSFAKGIDWTIETDLSVSITNLLKDKWVPVKGTKVKAFNVDFSTNVSLPDYIGLGKSVSLGFGIIKRMDKLTNHHFHQSVDEDV